MLPYLNCYLTCDSSISWGTFNSVIIIKVSLPILHA